MNLGQVSWALFEWARNPYYILVVIYIFGPYFSTEVIGDPVRGQAQIAPALHDFEHRFGRRASAFAPGPGSFDSFSLSVTIHGATLPPVTGNK